MVSCIVGKKNSAAGWLLADECLSCVACWRCSCCFKIQSQELECRSQGAYSYLAPMYVRSSFIVWV
eukprot:scaffold3095_cov106-Skeletonema_dohrnii-CCMP3373.AAC.7